jgi:hypothetical protein
MGRMIATARYIPYTLCTYTYTHALDIGLFQGTAIASTVCVGSGAISNGSAASSTTSMLAAPPQQQQQQC